MARPMRKDADYFPFICKEGKTFSILRNRYPLEGVGFFTELCIILTTTPDHHIQLLTDLDFEYFVSRIGCPKEKAESIIELLFKTGKIHNALWAKARVIVIPDLLESLKDAYERRNNDIITIEEIVSVYINKVNDDNNDINAPHLSTKDSKGKDSKGKETKPKDNIDYNKYVDYYNSKVDETGYLSKCIKLTDSRKKSIKTRLEEYSEEILFEVLAKVFNSDFLTGKSTDWSASFDWIFNKSNFLKIYENNYKNKSVDKLSNTNNIDLQSAFAGNEQYL